MRIPAGRQPQSAWARNQPPAWARPPPPVSHRRPPEHRWHPATSALQTNVCLQQAGPRARASERVMTGTSAPCRVMAARGWAGFAMSEHNVPRECDMVRMRSLTVLVPTRLAHPWPDSFGWVAGGKSPRRVVIPCRALTLRQDTDYKYLAGVTKRRSVAPWDGTACSTIGVPGAPAAVAPACC